MGTDATTYREDVVAALRFLVSVAVHVIEPSPNVPTRRVLIGAALNAIKYAPEHPTSRVSEALRGASGKLLGSGDSTLQIERVLCWLVDRLQDPRWSLSDMAALGAWARLALAILGERQSWEGREGA